MKIHRDKETTQSAGGRLMFVILLLLVVLMAARTPLDSDVWWHLRSGQVTVETGRPLLVDIFSYTREGQAWVNHSWLAQVILYGLYQLAGYSGLVLWVCVLAVICLAFAFQQMKGPAWWRALLVILAGVAIAPVWSPRPQAASLALLAGLGWWLERWKKGDLRGIWGLPVLFLVWSNLHAGYSLGFLLLAAFLGGQVLNHLLGMEEEALPWRSLGKVLLWVGLAFLAVAINPNGADMWRIPFQTIGISSLQQFIPEWASPDFHDPVQQPILLLAALLLGAVGFSGRKMKGEEWLTAAGFLVLALLSRRNIAPFAIVASPIIARHGWQAVEGWRKRTRLQEKLKLPALPKNESRPHPGINLLIVGLIALAAFSKLGVVSLPAVVQASETAIFPQGALDWMRGHPVQGRTFNEYAWGGYLIWFLPEEKVFVDGRTDLFGDEIIGQWREVIQAEEPMQEILERWMVERVVVMPDRPLAGALLQAGWVMKYQDPYSIILERPRP